MKYVLLDCDYNQREDYRFNKEVDFSMIKDAEKTTEFVDTVIDRLEKLPENVICDIGFEPFVLKADAEKLLDENVALNSIEVLDDLVYATCLIEGEPEFVDRGLENICERVVSLTDLYKKIEDRGYQLPVISTEDIEEDILTGNMLKRENLLVKYDKNKRLS